jgi:hypothetical protein
VTRNAASLVEAPKVPRRDLSPWTLDETLMFLEQAIRCPVVLPHHVRRAFGASVCTTPGTAAPRSSPRLASRLAS